MSLNPAAVLVFLGHCQLSGEDGEAERQATGWHKASGGEKETSRTFAVISQCRTDMFERSNSVRLPHEAKWASSPGDEEGAGV